MSENFTLRYQLNFLLIYLVDLIDMLQICQFGEIWWAKAGHTGILAHRDVVFKKRLLLSIGGDFLAVFESHGRKFVHHCPAISVCQVFLQLAALH